MAIWLDCLELKLNCCKKSLQKVFDLKFFICRSQEIASFASNALPSKKNFFESFQGSVGHLTFYLLLLFSHYYVNMQLKLKTIFLTHSFSGKRKIWNNKKIISLSLSLSLSLSPSLSLFCLSVFMNLSLFKCMQPFNPLNTWENDE